MKIRIKFKKFSSMKFIGHLDMMRYFQKAMRRAEIDIRYSEGFSPHQIMSFAAPLGVGITSEGEYLDIEVHSTRSSAESVAALNATMVPGVEILSYVQLPDKAKNAMSIVAAADYELFVKEGYDPIYDVDTYNALIQKHFHDAETFTIIKKTKKSEKEIDLKEFVYKFYAKEVDGKVGFFIQIATGSEKNIKPELLLFSFFEKAGVSIPELGIQIHRKEVYFLGEDGSFQTLESQGEIIA